MASSSLYFYLVVSVSVLFILPEQNSCLTQEYIE